MVNDNTTKKYNSTSPSASFLKKKRLRSYVADFVLATAPVIIPIFVLGGFASVVVNNYIQHETATSQEQTLRRVSGTFESILSDVDSLFLLFGVNANIRVDASRLLNTNYQDMSLDDIRFLDTMTSFLDSIAYSKPYIDSAYVYYPNNQGMYLTSGTGIGRFTDRSDPNWLEDYEHLPGPSPAVSIVARTVHPASFSTENFVTFYRRLSPGGSKRSDGVAVMNADRDRLVDFLDSVNDLQGSVFVVLNRSGDVILDTNSAKAATIERFPSIVDNDAVSRKVATSDGTFIVSVVRSSSNQWKYVLVSPETEVMRLAGQIRLVWLLAIIVSAFIGLSGTYLRVHKNRQQIRRLVAIIEAARAGRPLPRFDDTKDELGYVSQELVRAFITQDFLKTQASERQYRLQFMELRALQAQMNPHFLLNTLETANWKVKRLTKSPSKATKILANLSEILKYALGDINTFVPLQEEISTAHRYVEIQKVRYRSKFSFRWNCDASALEANVPRFILQPLIENAISHGIVPRKGPGLVEVEVGACADHRIQLIVRDDGVGMGAETLKEVTNRLSEEYRPGSGIGLHNLYRRMKLLFGSDASLQMESEPNGGTVVRLSFPFNGGTPRASSNQMGGYLT